MRRVQMIFIFLMVLPPVVALADADADKKSKTKDEMVHGLMVNSSHLLDITLRLRQMHDFDLKNNTRLETLNYLMAIVNEAYFSEKHILDLMLTHHLIEKLSQDQTTKDDIAQKINVNCFLYRENSYNLVKNLQRLKHHIPKDYFDVLDESTEAVFKSQELMKKGFAYEPESIWR
ncbi:MAG: hypothetical protein HQK81_13750 [Desulfovibrionaceae bacterium]|nr:hypothetical protein [Desulfovibrionaceae bacterium]MBF0515108.1 hypothetical protein [Desulfovibrionaceae bacterium]